MPLADVMYVAEAVQPLVASLKALSGPRTDVLVAHGRNRFAQEAFWRAAAAAGFAAESVGPAELDPVYQCSDVSVYRLRLHA